MWQLVGTTSYHWATFTMFELIYIHGKRVTTVMCLVRNKVHRQRLTKRSSLRCGIVHTAYTTFFLLKKYSIMIFDGMVKPTHCPLVILYCAGTVLFWDVCSSCDRYSVFFLFKPLLCFEAYAFLMCLYNTRKNNPYYAIIINSSMQDIEIKCTVLLLYI